MLGPRELDLRLNDPFDRFAALARFAGRREGIVEVGPDLGGGAGLGDRVADAAFLHEEDATPLDVGGAGPAAGGGEGDRREGGEGEKDADRVGGLGIGMRR